MLVKICFTLTLSLNLFANSNFDYLFCIYLFSFNRRTLDGRVHFKVHQFAIDNGLMLIPVAGNFLQAKFDAQVTILLKQLGVS